MKVKIADETTMPCLPWPLAPGLVPAMLDQLLADYPLPQFPIVSGDYQYGPDGAPDYAIYDSTRPGSGFEQDDLSDCLWVMFQGPLEFGKTSQQAQWFFHMAGQICSGSAQIVLNGFEVLTRLMAFNLIMDVGAGDDYCAGKMPGVILAYGAQYLEANRADFCPFLRFPESSGEDQIYAWTKDAVEPFACASIFTAVRYLCPDSISAWLGDMIRAGGTMFKMQLVVFSVAFSGVILDEELDWLGVKRNGIERSWEGIWWLVRYAHRGYGPPVTSENVRNFRGVLTSILTEETVYDWAEEFGNEFPKAKWPDYWLKQYLKLYLP